MVTNERYETFPNRVVLSINSMSGIRNENLCFVKLKFHHVVNISSTLKINLPKFRNTKNLTGLLSLILIPHIKS